MPALRGEDVDLRHYHGQVILIVNVASACGYTPQYRGLQALYTKYAPQGFVVLGFPCNQFGHQEPGTAAQIAAFCEQRYGVTFPLFAKVEVNGPRQCALYKALTSQDTRPVPAGPVDWNFEKFLLARAGQVVARFSSGVTPESRQLVERLEQELAQPLPTV
ncbi:MAG: glutathione peroxidase [Candidatus Tectomicrobia bacterium]|uniref:Glutathione peroxidase n=1 Tax=Tectimicrobiota bacterium TaxID=2528274 RepID=A0A937W243_UNCTE|nr:glutathione peroxidase [Candidatus Tectomicrobia bacterium]